MDFLKKKVRFAMFFRFSIFLLLSSCISVYSSQARRESVRALLPVECPPGNPKDYIAVLDACYSSNANFHSRLASGICKDTGDHSGRVISTYRASGGSKKVWLLTYFYEDANTEDTMAHGLGSVLKCGVKKLNISGGGELPSQEERELIKKLIMSGVKIYAAAGNGGNDLAEVPFYPAAYRGVMAIGGRVCVGKRLNKSNFGSKVERYECDHSSDMKAFGTSFAAPRAAGKDEAYEGK